MKYLIYIFLFFSTVVFSQVTKIDNLTLVLENHPEKDTVRVKALNRLASDIYRNNQEKAVKLINESLSISDSLHYQFGILESEYVLGEIYSERLQLNKADSILHKSLKGYKKINYKLGISKVYKQLGIVDFYRDDDERALSFYYKSLKTNEEVNDLLLKANCYNNIALIHDNRSNFDKSFKFYSKALLIYRKLGDKKRISLALNNIVTIYIKKEKYDKAITVLKESLMISKEINNLSAIAHTNNNLGLTFYLKKEYDLALSYCFKAVNYHKKVNNYSGLCNTYYGIVDIYIRLKKNKLALKYLKKGETIANKYHLLKRQKESFLLRSKLFAAKKNYSKSLEFYKKYKIYYDSIYSIRSSNKIAELEVKYKHSQKELKLKEIEIELNKQVEETKQKLERSKRNILYGLLIILALMVTLAFTVYKSRLKYLSVVYKRISLEQKLLRSQMKPHFIFNSLAVLQGIFLHKDYDKANQYLSNFSRLLRSILETSRKEVITLETELQLIKDYINLRNISGNHPICNYTIKIENGINIHKTTIPPMIIQPIVENSFEHGFIDESKKYNLSIAFNIDKKYLFCTIIDDGEGVFKTKNNNKESISSTIIKEQLTFLSEKFNDQYDIKIIDRSKEGEKGTKVILKLPFKNSNND